MLTETNCSTCKFNDLILIIVLNVTNPEKVEIPEYYDNNFFSASSLFQPDFDFSEIS